MSILKKYNQGKAEKEAIQADKYIKDALNTSNIYKTAENLKSYLRLVENSKQSEIYEPEDAKEILLDKLYSFAWKGERPQIIDSLNGSENPKIDIKPFGLEWSEVKKYIKNRAISTQTKKLVEIGNQILDLDKEGKYNMDALFQFEAQKEHLDELASKYRLPSLKESERIRAMKDYVSVIFVKAGLSRLSAMLNEGDGFAALDENIEAFEKTKELVLKNADKLGENAANVKYRAADMEEEMKQKIKKVGKLIRNFRNKLYREALDSSETLGQFFAYKLGDFGSFLAKSNMPEVMGTSAFDIARQITPSNICYRTAIEDFYGTVGKVCGLSSQYSRVLEDGDMTPEEFEGIVEWSLLEPELKKGSKKLEKEPREYIDPRMEIVSQALEGCNRN